MGNLLKNTRKLIGDAKLRKKSEICTQNNIIVHVLHCVNTHVLTVNDIKLNTNKDTK